jgi:hypothetical protein
MQIHHAGFDLAIAHGSVVARQLNAHCQRIAVGISDIEINSGLSPEAKRATCTGSRPCCRLLLAGAGPLIARIERSHFCAPNALSAITMMAINTNRIFACRWLDEIGEMNLVGIQIPRRRICAAVIVGDAPS